MLSSLCIWILNQSLKTTWQNNNRKHLELFLFCIMCKYCCNKWLTWNELFLLNVTIFSTLPKRWKIWCSMSSETGYSSDSTITRKTVFGPPADIVWCTPCGTGSVPDIGNGDPDADDVIWKSWFCNATDAFYRIAMENKNAIKSFIILVKRKISHWIQNKVKNKTKTQKILTRTEWLWSIFNSRWFENCT